MKNKNLLLAVLTAMTALWTTGANAQTEYKYSFEGFDVIADGWRVETTNYSNTWEQDGSTGFASPHDGEKQMRVNWSHSKQDERLVSPAIKLENNATLTFWHFINNNYDAAKGSYYTVEISTDNGATWNELWSVTRGNEYESAITVDLGAYSGETVNISWHAYDNTGKGLTYGWCVDDVTVSVEGTATGIETVTADNKAVARKGIYNINGIKMDGEWESMPKGVYVVDGKKKVKN